MFFNFGSRSKHSRNIKSLIKPPNLDQYIINKLSIYDCFLFLLLQNLFFRWLSHFLCVANDKLNCRSSCNFGAKLLSVSFFNLTAYHMLRITITQIVFFEISYNLFLSDDALSKYIDNFHDEIISEFIWIQLTLLKSRAIVSWACDQYILRHVVHGNCYGA